MSEENISQKFRLKNIDESRNYFIKEINQNELKDWFGENKIFFQRVLLNSPSKNKPNDIIHLT